MGFVFARFVPGSTESEFHEVAGQSGLAAAQKNRETAEKVARVGLQALAAGKHVLVEKPAFPSSADFQTVIDARNRAGLTQQALARKMGTTQPVVARLESGRTRPSMRTLERLAKATGSRLLIRFEPRERKRAAG